MQTRICIAVLALSGAAFSQVTTPVGYNTVEGNAVFFNYSSASRLLQSIDTTQSAVPAVYTKFALRRDGTSAASTAYAARTLDLELTLGKANTVIQSSDLMENVAGATIAYSLKSTSMPDWTNPPATPPAPFDFAILLDAPYTHPGGPLVWMTRHLNSTNTSLTVVDRHYNAYASAAGTLIVGSVGCIATGRTTAFAHTTALRNGGPATGGFGMHLQVSPTNCPSSAPVFLNIDVIDSAISVPFLCATVHALPVISLPIGTSSATGTMPVKHISFGYNPSLISASLVTQLLSLDAGQPPTFLPLALSNGRTTTMPADPTVVCAPAVYGFSSLPTTTGTLFYGGCIIALLQ